MALPCVGIVIVNWNSQAQLSECVASIDAHGDGFVFGTVVVDNGSTDGSEQLPRTRDTQLLLAGCNLGFARACNLGALRFDCEYLLFLNPDARLLPETLARTIAYMNSPEAAAVGICGVRLIGEDGLTQAHTARFPTAADFIAHSTGLSALFPRAFGTWHGGGHDHETEMAVDHVIGAYLFIRNTVFRQARGFDERFFVYLEDLDLSLRTRKLGWRTHYLATATAFHKGGGTSAQVKAHRLFYSIRSRLLYAAKHFKRSQAMAVAAAALLVEPFVRVLGLIARGAQRSDIVSTLVAYRMLIGDIPAIVRKARGA